mgnify:CR=1 FL=1
MYSEKVMDHFQHPRNVGEIENASGVGTVGNAKCGDIMRMYLDIDDNGIIQDCKFKTFGCGAAVATSSMATELVKGKTIQSTLLRQGQFFRGDPGEQGRLSAEPAETLQKAWDHVQGRGGHRNQAHDQPAHSRYHFPHGSGDHHGGVGECPKRRRRYQLQAYGQARQPLQAGRLPDERKPLHHGEVQRDRQAREAVQQNAEHGQAGNHIHRRACVQLEKGPESEKGRRAV